MTAHGGISPPRPLTSEDAVFDRVESGVRSYCRDFPVVFDWASGSLLRDTAGRTYIDFLAGCSALNYGHNDPDMVDALIDHLSRRSIVHGLDLHTTAKEAFLERLESVVLAPRGLDYRVQFTGPTGTNAVEAALKLARKVTGRTDVVAFTNGFHGVTLGALGATGNRLHRMGPEVPLPGVVRALYDGYLGPEVDTMAILEKLLDDPSSGVDRPAAFIVETVQGEGGLNAATAKWMQRLDRLAHRIGALLIIDDVQAGCGRTGRFFSFEEMGIEPDLVTLSKSISGFGLPLALLLIKPEWDQWRPGEHNGTFRGNNLAFVTARVALDKFWSDDDFGLQLARREQLIADALTSIADRVPDARIKGRGLFRGVEVASGAVATAITRRAFELGLIIETSGARGEVVKVLAPLTTPDEVLIDGLDRLSSAVDGALADAETPAA